MSFGQKFWDVITLHEVSDDEASKQANISGSLMGLLTGQMQN